MNRELANIPGVIWNFSQPIADNMEEAVSGVKGELATKVYGDDLKTLEEKADQIVDVMRRHEGNRGPRSLSRPGPAQPERHGRSPAAARYQINVADVQDAIQTAVGGNALTQVLQGEARYDLVMRYLPQYRDTQEAIENIRLLSPTGERVSLAQLCNIEERTALPKSTAKETSATSPSNTACAGATWAAPSRKQSESQPAGSAAARVPHQLGGRIREPEESRGAAAHHRAVDGLPHLHDHLRRFWLGQMGLPAPGERRRGARRRPAGAIHHGDALQRLVRRRIPGPVRRFGADRRDHGGVHQPIARARAIPSRMPPSKGLYEGCGRS